MSLRTFLRRWLDVEKPAPPRMVDLVNRIDDLDSRVEYLGSELRTLRGRVTGGLRKARDAEADEQEEGTPTEAPAPAEDSKTAYLARRFRRF